VDQELVMTPAKKRKTAVPKKPCPPAPVAPPPPVLTKQQRKIFSVIQTRHGIGLLFLTAGVGVLGGHWFYHREWHTPSFVGSMLAMLFGALLLDPTSVKDALATLGGSAKDLLPFVRKSDLPPPPAG
jgi:hypothetical protein